MAGQQFGLLGAIPTNSGRVPDQATSPVGEGASDSGFSGPSSGLGYGLLGRVGAGLQNHDCADCQSGQPCDDCDDVASGETTNTNSITNQGNGQIWHAQFPVPMPGLLPPPMLPQAQKPGQPPIVGDPNAWWNDDVRNLPDRFRNWVEARPSPEVEAMCEEQYNLDVINCNLKRAYAGKKAAETCYQQATLAYSDCLKKGKKSDIPRYDRTS